MATATKRFRSMSWRTLLAQPEILTEAGTLDGQRAPEWLYFLGEECRIGFCDFFFSHSWHDDSFLKWNALCNWADDYESNWGRPPTLWLDRVCIDQSNVQADLPCLPIFLAACNGLLIISGLTYPGRLWCCVELFVYWRGAAQKRGSGGLGDSYGLISDFPNSDLAEPQARSFDTFAA